MFLKKILHSKKPNCLISWRFFCPNPSIDVRIHRKIFLKTFFGSPLWLKLPLNLWKCFCWYGFYAEWYTIKSFKRYARKTKQTDHVGFIQQLLCLIQFTYGYNLSPGYMYKYRFYLPDKRETLFHYFYAFEQPMLHDLMNASYDPNFAQAKTFVGDKLKFAACLESLKIPCVETKTLEHQAEYSNVDALFIKKDLFIKPNRSSSSQDAFQLKYDSYTSRYEIHPIHGKVITEPPLVTKHLSYALSRGDMIVQPFLMDHPEIALISRHAATTTFRAITVKSPDQVAHTLYLQMEIPDQKHIKKHHQFYKIYPLNLSDFSMDSVFQKKQERSVDIPRFSTELVEMLRQALRHCERAHDQCIDLYSVGFDFVITASGPVLLEANYNWNIDLIYNVCKPHELLSFLKQSINLE